MSVYDPSTIKFLADSLGLAYCLVASGVFYIYDILLTLDVEVEFFWKDPLTGAAALFFANQYLALASLVLNLFELLPLRTDKR
ncbi:hypothetical protein GSI_10935 [Ganoderma sinense ZZ0214-1]|uniref:DUF6533 domain-containing protein n=1 Tax=Ganoderma sinense ZZ0214-1 TaxID=1077348 RepID=A0A2G8S200_9APHY|nr:hypothetical protein GSI_10935 [Ganoderma sinense ZZ0214-1]